MRYKLGSLVRTSVGILYVPQQKVDAANNGDRSGVDSDGGREGATQVMNTTIVREDEWTVGCHQQQRSAVD